MLTHSIETAIRQVAFQNEQNWLDIESYENVECWRGEKNLQIRELDYNYLSFSNQPFPMSGIQ